MKRVLSASYSELKDQYRGWKSNQEEAKSREERRLAQYLMDREAAFDPIKNELESKLSIWSNLHFQISVQPKWGSVIDVEVRCNENEKFNDDVALAWNYEVSLTRDGDVVKESSSWSGLKATTREQIDSLQSSVEALRYLNNVDWENLLTVTLPDYEDYRQESVLNEIDKEFKRQLSDSFISELIGSNTWVRIVPFESSGYRDRATLYANIVRETPSQYEVKLLSQMDIDNGKTDSTYTQRVKKSNFIPVKDNEGNYITIELENNSEE